MTGDVSLKDLRLVVQDAIARKTPSFSRVFHAVRSVRGLDVSWTRLAIKGGILEGASTCDCVLEMCHARVRMILRQLRSAGSHNLLFDSHINLRTMVEEAWHQITCKRQETASVLAITERVRDLILDPMDTDLDLDRD